MQTATTLLVMASPLADEKGSMLRLVQAATKTPWPPMLIACVGDAGAGGVVGEAGDQTARVVAAGAFASGVTIVRVGVVGARDTGGPETMPNTCSMRVIRCSWTSRCLLRVKTWCSSCFVRRLFLRFFLLDYDRY
jgi:hypothetical protein